MLISILNSIVSLVDACIWPLASVWILIIVIKNFRVPITKLIDRVNAIKVTKKGVEIEIANLSKLHSAENAAPAEVRKELPLRAIDESYKHLETSVTDVVSEPMKKSLYSATGELLANEILTEAEAEAVYKLREIRNKVLSGELPITYVSASSFSDIAYKISKNIKKEVPPRELKLKTHSPHVSVKKTDDKS